MKRREKSESKRPPASKKKKAVAYLRVSGKSQIDGDGFPRQMEAIEKYAKANGLKIVGEYRDEGVSGKEDFDGRDAFGELLDRLESNGVRTVLVERADRLSRDSVIAEILLREFRALGVQVIAADGGVDLTEGDQDNPTAKLVRQILASVAEFEKDVLVLKLRAARMRKRKEKGVCEGRKPFGTREGEETVVRRIGELRKSAGGVKLGYRLIAQLLNKEGHPTRSGKPWSHQSVASVVKRNFPGSQ